MSLPPPMPAGAPKADAPTAAASAAWAPPITPQQSLTAADVLADPAHPAPFAVPEAATATRATLDQLPPTVRKATDREIGRALAEALGFPLAEVVVRAWTSHKALTAAAERTRAKGREVVTLADHTVTSTHRPTVTVALDGADVATIPLVVQLSIRMVGVAAVVEKAMLSAIESGASTVTAKVTIEGHPVATRTMQCDARRVVPLDRPAQLLPPLPG